MQLVMGIDIGTTAIKVIVLKVTSKSTFETLIVDSIPHDLISIHHGWAEESADIWRDNLYAILSRISNQIDLSELKAIGVTGMVPALVLLDQSGMPIRNSIQQNDMRTGFEIKELKEMLEKDDSYFKKTGSHVNSQHILPRLLYLKTHESDNYSRICHILGSYDYAAYLLTGNMHIEHNWALESGLFDFDGNLIKDVFSLSSLDESVLPPVVSSNAFVGMVKEDTSMLTGIPAGVKVFAGTADHVASAFATGARENGDLVLKLGGAGDILLSLDHLVIDDRLFIDYFCSSSCPYILNGCTAASGSLLKWFKQQFGSDFAQMDKDAESVPAGSDGLIMLPYVLGEKTPIFDPNAKGVIFGLKLSHTKAHIYRSMLEAVAYAFRHHVDIFNESGIEIKNVYITNGGSTSQLWRQIMADVLGLKVNYIKTNPGSCLGAAFIAAISSNLLSEDAIEFFIKQKQVTYPIEENTRIYDKSYKIYRELYPRLKDLF